MFSFSLSRSLFFSLFLSSRRWNYSYARTLQVHATQVHNLMTTQTLETPQSVHNAREKMTRTDQQGPAPVLYALTKGDKKDAGGTQVVRRNEGPVAQVQLSADVHSA